MYSIDNQAVIDAIVGDCRTFRALVEFPDRSYSGAQVGSITAEHTQTDSDTLQLGAVLSRRAEIVLHDIAVMPQKGESFSLYLYLLDWSRTAQTSHSDLRAYTHEALAQYTHREIKALTRTGDPDGVPLGGVLIPFGEYVVRRVRRSGSEVRVTAYDRLQDADKPYEPGIDFPADAGAVTDDVLAQLGVRGRRSAEAGNLLTQQKEPVLDADGEEVIVSAEYSFVIPDAPEGMTCREVLGGIAAMYGGNAILDREGYFTTLFFAAGNNYPANLRQHADEPEVAEADVTLTGIVCHAAEQVEYSRGTEDGIVIEFDSPWMSDKRLGEIWAQLGHANLTWRPGSMYWRLADPRYDLGDRIGVSIRESDGRAGQCSMPLTSVIYRFDGGLMADVEATGDTGGI